ncbi:glutathionylspermidine synthase family protein [Limnoraphis robusta Tam1]|uniref:glutathionylspermidine synthase family protein n=1 Tax=Limnoraphis robusta TaxID=1118279 RepID=UPI002B1F50F1|nr:glutathionylspermidine synthase family protein [Limnoraphis robusta]MEA5539567.1 glutathionylspermidine synthase family protein [Limnoraphis robusta Tam1]
MKRIPLKPRPHWEQKCDEVGFHYYNLDGLYWNESVCYQFTSEQIDSLEAATQELHQLCLEAVDCIITENRYTQLSIPPEFFQLCRQSWERGDPSLYGRFDFVYDGIHPPKLLEYNADTPTALLEASIVQWTWLEENFPDADQFNSIHEKLLEQFQQIYFNLSPTQRYLHFTCERDTAEDLGTVEYLRDVAIQAGFETKHLYIDEMGWNSNDQCFCDLEDYPIQALFKLYPWEWMIEDEFGKHLLSEPMLLLEPAWKMILSNKAILPILWELFPDHPNLLPAYFDSSQLSHPYLSKPIFSREGANINIYYGDRSYQTDGIYQDEPLIYQSYWPLPEFDRYYPVIGSWIVGDQPAGIGIREDQTPITQNTSQFIPHYFI